MAAEAHVEVADESLRAACALQGDLVEIGVGVGVGVGVGLGLGVEVGVGARVHREHVDPSLGEIEHELRLDETQLACPRRGRSVWTAGLPGTLSASPGFEDPVCGSGGRGLCGVC